MAFDITEELTKSISNLLEEHGISHWKAWEGANSNREVASLLGVYRGKAIAIEIKSPGSWLTDAQKQFLKDWEREGGISVIAYSVEDVIKSLDLPRINLGKEKNL